MAKKSKLIFKVAALFALVIFSKCANQLPPGGGDVDKTPPTIIDLHPANGTTNYHENYFELTFSEYVDKRSIQDAIFISPSLKYPLEYDWSGRSLTINFQDTLKQNTTYTITIGTDVRDLNNNNKMAEPLTFAFSTGDKIHTGKISGRIYDPNSDGIMIFAYKNDGEAINPGKQSPDYVSQVGRNGKYSLSGIADGAYTIFAIRDKLKDLKYKKNEDEYGVQFKTVDLKDQLNAVNDVDFLITKEDTIAPTITNVIMKDRNHLLIEFTSKIDSIRLSPSNFYLFDSTANKKVLPKYIFKGDARPYQFYLVLGDTLEKKEGWILVSNGIYNIDSIKSTEGKNSITVKNDRDTLKIKPNRVGGELPDGKVDFEDAKINLTFNDAIDSTTVKTRLLILDSKKDNYPFAIKRIDDAAYIITVLSKLRQSTEYTINLNLKNYTDLSGNDIDSLFQNKITTSNELDFSGASGNIENNSDSSNVIVVLQNTTVNKIKYSQKAGPKSDFEFKKVVPGKYLAWGFKDKNKNGKYDYGTILPFKHSEEFKFYPDTLNLRARWPVGGVNIDFKK
ncbi:MAG: Ig-like domain-containing protein [Ignavibacteriales bacterium]|nr:Ig-like domain-containing protein [Ignavibacteriales bacterium]